MSLVAMDAVAHNFPRNMDRPAARRRDRGSVIHLNSSEIQIRTRLTPTVVLPDDHERALLIGRVWVPAEKGPVPVLVTQDGLYDLSHAARTVSQLLELESPIAALQSARALPRIATLTEVLENTDPQQRDPSRPWLLSPCDLQALKASGVTFVSSMTRSIWPGKPSAPTTVTPMG